MSIKCKIGLHNYGDWKPVFDSHGSITGHWYCECKEISCFKCECIFNFDKVPEPLKSKRK